MDDASAIGWLAPHSLMVDLREQHRVEFDIAMSDEASVRRIHLPQARDAQDPLLSLRLRETGSLKPGELITQVAVHSSHDPGAVKNPVLETADLFRQRAQQFNQSLDRVRLEPNERQLEQMAAEEADFEDEIIERLIARGIVHDSPKRTASRFTYLYLNQDSQRPGWYYEELEVADGKRSIVIRIGPPPIGPKVSTFGPHQEAAQALGIVDAEVTVSSSGSGELALARLLAFGDRDVQLAYPDQESVLTR